MEKEKKYIVRAHVICGSVNFRKGSQVKESDFNTGVAEAHRKSGALELIEEKPVHKKTGGKKGGSKGKS